MLFIIDIKCFGIDIECSLLWSIVLLCMSIQMSWRQWCRAVKCLWLSCNVMVRVVYDRIMSVDVV